MIIYRLDFGHFLRHTRMFSQWIHDWIQFPSHSIPDESKRNRLVWQLLCG